MRVRGLMHTQAERRSPEGSFWGGFEGPPCCRCCVLPTLGGSLTKDTSGLAPAAPTPSSQESPLSPAQLVTSLPPPSPIEAWAVPMRSVWDHAQAPQPTVPAQISIRASNPDTVQPAFCLLAPSPPHRPNMPPSPAQSVPTIPLQSGPALVVDMDQQLFEHRQALSTLRYTLPLDPTRVCMPACYPPCPSLFLQVLPSPTLPYSICTRPCICNT